MKPPQFRLCSLSLPAWLAAGGLLLCAPFYPQPAMAQPFPASMACPGPEAIDPVHLYGLWTLTLWPATGQPDAPTSTGAMLFEAHPEYAGSVRGTLRRSSTGNDRQAMVSGDVEGGEFNLDESADGMTMDAVWTGAPQACGREITGERRPAQGRDTNEPTLLFLLQKQPGWQ